MAAAMFISLPAPSAVAANPRPSAERSLVIMVRPVVVKSEKELMILIDELDAAGLDFVIEEREDEIVVLVVVF